MSLLRLLLNLLREIADENAYRRHLAAHGTEHSPGAWRQFCDNRLKSKYGCAKCC
jgi:hypothetical protein